MRTRRCSTVGVFLMLAALVLAGCGSPQGGRATPAAEQPTAVGQQATTAAAPTAAGATAGATAPAGDQAPADRLRWSLEGVSDLSSIDPAKPGDAPTITAINLIFSGLIRLDEKLEVQPDCASEWKVSDDGTTYTFTIRDGLMFADG